MVKKLNISIPHPIIRIPKDFVDANTKSNNQKVVKTKMLISDDNKEIKIVVEQ